MTQEERRYISYLLRLWQIRNKGELVWRASLESPLTGERRGFASLAKLIDFLELQTAVSLNPKENVDGPVTSVKPNDDS